MTGPLLFNFKMDCYRAIGIMYIPMKRTDFLNWNIIPV